VGTRISDHSFDNRLDRLRETKIRHARRKVEHLKDILEGYGVSNVIVS